MVYFVLSRPVTGLESIILVLPASKSIHSNVMYHIARIAQKIYFFALQYFFCPTNFWQVYSSVDVDFIIAISILTTSSTLVATIGSWYKRFDCDRCKTECSLFARVAKVWKDHNNWTSTIDVNRGGARWSFNDLPFSWFNKINVLLWVV